MMNLTWQRSRLAILGGCSGAIVIALLLVLTDNSRNTFPQSMVGDDWYAVSTDRLNSDHKLSEGRKYQPSADKDSLNMEIYMIPNSRGETLSLMNQYSQTQLKPSDVEVKSNSEIGSYGLWIANDRTHLNTCIHSSGKTAFTAAKFSQLANANLKSRLLPWIFGLSDLRDWNCFWVNISVVNDGMTEPEAGNLLEQRLLKLLQEAKFD